MTRVLSTKTIKNYILIFITAQLAMWYGGLANLIPNTLVAKWNLIQVASIIVLILLFIGKRKRPNFYTLIFIISQLALVISTILNANILDMTNMFRAIALVLLVDLYSNNIDNLASPLMLIFEIMVYYNLFTVLTSQVDAYGAYYGALGYDNDFTRYLLSAYIWALFYGFSKKRHIRAMALISAIHFTLFYIWTGTGIVSVLVMDTLVILVIGKAKRITILQGYLAYLAMTIIIVFFKLQNIFSFLIVDVLHKDLTFTGRTNIWDTAIDYIAKKPIQGYGIMGQTLETLYLGEAHCHNAFLEQLFRGGILYAVLFFIMIVLLHRSTKRHPENKLVSVLCMSLCGIWIVCVTESILDDYIIWLVFALIYNIQHSIQTKSNTANPFVEQGGLISHYE